MLRKTLIGVILAAGTFDIGSVIYVAYSAPYDQGYQTATKEAEDREAIVRQEMRDMGLCEFPEAFAKANRCPVRVIRTDQ